MLTYVNKYQSKVFHCITDHFENFEKRKSPKTLKENEKKTFSLVPFLTFSANLIFTEIYYYLYKKYFISIKKYLAPNKIFLSQIVIIFGTIAKNSTELL
jgi:hypothetical protein